MAPPFASVPANTASSPVPPRSSVAPLRSSVAPSGLSRPLSFSVAPAATASDALPFGNLTVEAHIFTELERIKRPAFTVVGPEREIVSSYSRRSPAPVFISWPRYGKFWFRYSVT